MDACFLSVCLQLVKKPPGVRGAVTGEIVDDIRNMGIVFQDIPYSCIFQIFARAAE